MIRSYLVGILIMASTGLVAQQPTFMDTLHLENLSEEEQCLAEWTKMGIADYSNTVSDSIKLVPFSTYLHQGTRFLMMCSYNIHKSSGVGRGRLHVELIKALEGPCVTNSMVIKRVFNPESGRFREYNIRYYMRFFDESELMTRSTANVLMGDGTWKKISDQGYLGKPVTLEEKNTKLHAFGKLKIEPHGHTLYSRYHPGKKITFDAISELAPRYKQTSYTVVTKDGKQGLLNQDLELVVPTKYDVIDIYRTKVVVGEIDGFMVIVNPENAQELTPRKYQLLTFNRPDDTFIATLKKGKKQVLVNMEGNEVGSYKE